MTVTRRNFFESFIRGSGWLTLGGLTKACCSDVTFKRSESFFVSAHNDYLGNHYIGAFNEKGKRVFSLPVSQRAHGMTVNPSHPLEVIYFSRDPGNEINLVNLASGKKIRTTICKKGRHFYGHGCFSHDGELFFTTENDFTKGHGVISVRDAYTLEVLDEYHSQGIGPHEIKMLPNEKIMVVANSGKLTHPEKPGCILNKGNLSSNLSYLDLNNGELLSRQYPPSKQHCIRHIDVNNEGLVAVSMQYEGNDVRSSLSTKKPLKALLASHRLGDNELNLFSAESYPWARLNYYIGSVASEPVSTGEQKIAAVTSLRGQRLLICDVSQGVVLKDYAIPQVRGVAYHPLQRAFVVSSSLGNTYVVDINHSDMPLSNLSFFHNTRWDTHLSAV